MYAGELDREAMSIQHRDPQKSIPSPLCAFYRSKIVAVEPILFLFLLSYMLYTTIVEQFYFQYYGAQILQNSSFVLPNGSFCVNSTTIDEYRGSNKSYKLDETDSNNLVIYTELASKLPSIPVTILMAPLTDRYGRRLGILIPSLGLLFQSVASILVVFFKVNPYYLIAASGVSGLCGDYASLIASCFAYTADISTPKRRSVRLAAAGGSLSLGQLVGVIVGGYWLAAVNCNFMPVFIFQAGALTLMIIYTLILPESLTKTERLDLLAKKKGSILSKYVEGVKLYCSHFSYSVWAMHILTVNLAVLGLNLGGSVIVSIYFLKAPPFEFTSLQIGYYQAFRAAAKGVSNWLLFLLAFCKVRDTWVVLYGSLVSATGNILHGLVNKNWQVYTISAIKGTEAVGFTTSRSLASKLVKSEEQGSLFSIVASVESLAALLASVSWPFVYPLTINHGMRAGSSYIFMGALEFLIIPFLVSILLVDWKRKTAAKAKAKEKHEDVENSIHTRQEGQEISYGPTISSDAEYQPLLTNNDRHRRRKQHF